MSLGQLSQASDSQLSLRVPCPHPTSLPALPPPPVPRVSLGAAAELCKEATTRAAPGASNLPAPRGRRLTLPKTGSPTPSRASGRGPSSFLSFSALGLRLPPPPPPAACSQNSCFPGTRRLPENPVRLQRGRQLRFRFCFCGFSVSVGFGFCTATAGLHPGNVCEAGRAPCPPWATSLKGPSASVE